MDLNNTGYNGNRNLKQVGLPIEFTAERLEEYIKCKNDPVYFIITYCKVVSLDRGFVNFDLYEYQQRFINAIHTNRKVAGMFSRQQGKTTTSAAYILHYVTFNDHKTVAILANKSAAAREVMSRIQLMFEALPIWLQQGIKTWNKGDIELENGSKIFTSATTGSGIRGKSVNMLYIDEISSIANTIAEEFFTSTYPVISSGKDTKILMTSTPIGYNYWWKVWNEAENGINGFLPFKAEWHEHPERDEKWAAEQKAFLGEVKFNQEVLCVGKDTLITVKDKDTGEVITLTIGELYAKM